MTSQPESADTSVAFVQLVKNPGFAERIIAYIEHEPMQWPADEPSRARFAKVIVELSRANNEERLRVLEFAHGFIESQQAHQNSGTLDM